MTAEIGANVLQVVRLYYNLVSNIAFYNKIIEFTVFWSIKTINAYLKNFV